MLEQEVAKFVIAPAVAALVAVIGWAVAHYLSGQRDRKNKYRDIRTQYLITAYRTLFRVGVDRSIAKNAVECENAIADIQLLGTPKQILLAEKYTVKISSNGTADLTDLIRELRRDLRNELDLEPVSDEIHFLKIDVNRENA